MAEDTVKTRGSVSKKFRAPATLSSGIPVQILGESVQDSGRIRINTGTERIIDDSFCELSYIPKQDWRPLSASEAATVFDQSAAILDAERISIWKLPEEIARHFELFRNCIAKYNDEALLENLWTHTDYQRGRNKLFKLLHIAGAGESLKILGHYSRNPHCIASSINGEGKFVGLHIDSWVNASVSQRKSGFPSRFSVNLGPEPRYLNVLNLSLRQISTCTAEPLTEEPNDLVVEFLHDNPHYPLIQIAIEPGEAYIAPTEIMIHDATTKDKKYVDASTTLLGDFSVSTLGELSGRR